jgi:hypothetical protein
MGQSNLFVKVKAQNLKPLKCHLEPCLSDPLSLIIQVKEADPPIFGERFSMVTDTLATHNKSTLYAAPAPQTSNPPEHDINHSQVLVAAPLQIVDLSQNTGTGGKRSRELPASN